MFREEALRTKRSPSVDETMVEARDLEKTYAAGGASRVYPAEALRYE